MGERRPSAQSFEADGQLLNRRPGPDQPDRLDLGWELSCVATGRRADSENTIQDSNASNSGFDAGAIQTACSVRSVYDVVSTFGPDKRRLVESTGFGGLLKFPPIKSTNRRYSAWLMGRVDARNSRLTLPDGSTLDFTSEDVALVFDIPADGQNVSEAKQLGRDARDKMKQQCWPHTNRDHQSIKAVESVLVASYSDPMTPDQEDAFKVAFVVFVMSTLFVPGAKHDYAHVDYWGALSNPSKIHEFNWAAYIHKRLLMAAAKYKTDIENGSRTPIITGCYLFLQVFYLDNMDIPHWSLDHSVRPRIACFTNDRIRAMIAADTRHRQHTKTAGVYGISKVRPRHESCYTWARAPCLQYPAVSPTEPANSLWRTVLSLVTILGVPLEAAGPLYMAATELDRPSEASNRRSTLDTMAILLKIVEPFRKGFNYSCDLHLDLQALDEVPDILHHYCASTDYSRSSCSCMCRKRAYGVGTHISVSDDISNMVVRSLGTLGWPDDGASKRPRFSAVSSLSTAGDMGGSTQTVIAGIDYEVIKIMARFYLLVRHARERIGLDLNTTSEDNDACQSVQQPSSLVLADRGKTPWELGESWGKVAADMEVPAHTAAATPGTMPRIVDYHPKYIEVMPAAARDQKTGFAEMEMDMFDAIIRCFRQNDDALYRAEGRVRWRHYFESDLLATVIAGWFDINNPSIRNQFVGAHLAYDIYNCSMLFFPVILHERWVCFSWNLKRNTIVVFDPICINIPGFPRRGLYTSVAEVLKTTLSSAIPSVIPGWRHDWTAASVMPFHWRYAGMPCSNRTGVLCAYFCRCFNGDALQPNITQAQVEQVAGRMFRDVIALHQSRGAQENASSLTQLTSATTTLG